MKKVVYFGMGFLPDKNAVAIREMVIADMLEEISFEPVLIGINKDVKLGEYKKVAYNGRVVYEVGYSQTIMEKIKDNYVFSDVIINIFQDIGVNSICAFIMQDYQYGPMQKLSKYCEKNKISFIADVMDWFVPTADASLFKNIFKSIDTYRRMYFLYPRLEKMICISRKFEDFFTKQGKTVDIVVIPPVVHKVNDIIIGAEEKNGKKQLVFAGNPGKHFDKEKLDWILKALYENKSEMILKILGADKEKTIFNNPELEKYMTENVFFIGQQEHEEVVNILRESDFSIIVRKKSKLSNYGFSSKIAEAFQYGVPVLATDVSDNSRYIKCGVNGFVCGSEYEEVKSMLEYVERLSSKDIGDMKKNAYVNSELYCDFYVESLKKIIEKGTV